jgi:hypothetical protein
MIQDLVQDIIFFIHLASLSFSYSKVRQIIEKIFSNIQLLIKSVFVVFQDRFLAEPVNNLVFLYKIKLSPGHRFHVFHISPKEFDLIKKRLVFFGESVNPFNAGLPLCLASIKAGKAALAKPQPNHTEDK